MGCDSQFDDLYPEKPITYRATAADTITELRAELDDTLHELNNTRAQLDYAERELLESEEKRRHLSDSYATLQDMNRRASEALIALQAKYDTVLGALRSVVAYL